MNIAIIIFMVLVILLLFAINCSLGAIIDNQRFIRDSTKDTKLYLKKISLFLIGSNALKKELKRDVEAKYQFELRQYNKSLDIEEFNSQDI